MSKASDFILELRTKSVEDLIKLGEDRRAELFALKFQAAVGSLEQTHKVGLLKKDIARIEMLLEERKKAGEVIAQNIKADYGKAVEEAEKAGKEVRQKQREMAKKLQEEQFGTDAASTMSDSISDDAIQAAMAKDDVESEVKVEKTTKKSAAKKEAAPKVDKPVVKKESAAKSEKSSAKKESAQKTDKPVVKKESAAKSEKPASKKPAAQKTDKPAAKKESAPKTEKSAAKKVESVEPIHLETGEAKGTGKGKAALADIKVKKLKVDAAMGEDIEGIELKLSKKPKDSKTYTFGSNAEVAKKQLAEAEKKAAQKKSEKTKATKAKGAK